MEENEAEIILCGISPCLSFGLWPLEEVNREEGNRSKKNGDKSSCVKICSIFDRSLNFDIIASLGIHRERGILAEKKKIGSVSEVCKLEKQPSTIFNRGGGGVCVKKI